MNSKTIRDSLTLIKKQSNETKVSFRTVLSVKPCLIKLRQMALFERHIKSLVDLSQT